MADPAEEQAAELEALRAIYADDFEVSETAVPTRFSIRLTHEPSEGKVLLTIGYTPQYPNEPPNITVQSLSNVGKERAEAIAKVLQKEAAEGVGEVMVFSLVSRTLECLEELPVAAPQEEDSGTGLRKPKIDDSAAIRHGTLVTRENFLEWKRKFDLERTTWGEARQAARAKDMELKKDRLTGRQFFTRLSAANANIDWALFNAENDDLDDFDDPTDDADDGADD